MARHPRPNRRRYPHLGIVRLANWDVETNFPDWMARAVVTYAFVGIDE